MTAPGDFPLDLPEILQGHDLDAMDPAELVPVISREDGTAQLAALGARIADGEAASLERADLIARLKAQHWTQQEIAAAAGISQAAVSKSLASTPGARALASSRSVPYLAGRMLGVALHLARTRNGLASERLADKMAGHRHPVTDATVGQLRHLLRKDLARPGVPAAYAAELADITARLDEAGPVGTLPGTLAARSEMMLAEHHQAAALTRAVAAARKGAAN